MFQNMLRTMVLIIVAQVALFPSTVSAQGGGGSSSNYVIYDAVQWGSDCDAQAFDLDGTDLDIAAGTGDWSTTGTLSGGAITGTSFVIGANTIDTNEWAFLDGLDQALKAADSVQFASITDGTATLTGGSLTTTGVITGNSVVSSTNVSTGTTGITISDSTITQDGSGNIVIAPDNELVLISNDLTLTGLATFGNCDVDTLNLDGNAITDSTGTIGFGDDNLSTTGYATIGNAGAIATIGNGDRILDLATGAFSGYIADDSDAIGFSLTDGSSTVQLCGATFAAQFTGGDLVVGDNVKISRGPNDYIQFSSSNFIRVRGSSSSGDLFAANSVDLRLSGPANGTPGKGTVIRAYNAAAWEDVLRVENTSSGNRRVEISNADTYIGDGGATNYAAISGTGTLSFAGSAGFILPSGTTPAPATEGALFLDTDASANGSIYCYSNGSWRKVVDLP